MTPEVEAILNRIGFGVAKYHDTSLFLGSGFDQIGGLSFNSAKEARRALNQIQHVKKAIDSLPDYLFERWEHASRRSEDWDNNRNVLGDALLGLRELGEQAEAAIYDPWEKYEGIRNRGADAIAYNMAKIYFLGKGEIPDGSARDSEGNPSGVYTRAVQDMFDVLEITDVGFRLPCKRAVERLSEPGNLEHLRMVRGGYHRMMYWLAHRDKNTR